MQRHVAGRLGIRSLRLSLRERIEVRGKSSRLFLWRRRNGANSNSREVFIGLQQIGAGPLDDLEQTIHRRNFFELLGQKPLEKIDRDVVVLLSSQRNQSVDLLSDMNFLIQRQLHRVARGLEF